MTTITVRTGSRGQFVPITQQVQEALKKEGIEDGLCTVFVPHTTAAVTINENADPDVVHDLLYQLDKLIPWDDPNYRHDEGNSAAHLKASLMGSSESIIVINGKLQLGIWQGVYFCEFDGPRERKVYISFR